MDIYLTDPCCIDCGNSHLSAGPLNWEYIQGIVTGENDPLHFPVAYPAISFDKSTTKTFYQIAGIISASIIVGFVISAAIDANKRLK